MEINFSKSGFVNGLRLRSTLQTNENTRIKAIRWSPNGQRLASVSADNLIRLWDVGARALSQTLIGHRSAFLDVAWYKSGRKLVTISADGSVGFWDDVEGVELSNVHLNIDNYYFKSLSSDGKQIAAISSASTISLWDTTTLETFQSMEGHSRAVTCTAWSSDFRFLASGSRDGTVRLWQIDSGQLIHDFKGHSDDVSDVTWSTDGTLIASGAKDNTIKLWDVEKCRLIGTLEAHRDDLKSVCFSHDNSFLVSKSLDESVMIWRCDTWEPVAIFDESTTQFAGPNVSFNPKTLSLATFDHGDNVIRIWELDAAILLGMTSPVHSVRYRNAKVVLVGDTGVGKSGLGKVLAGDKFRATKSTHGRYVRRLDLTREELGSGQEETRELLLWDLAGQPEFRLVHQLSLDQASVAVVLFDGSSPIDPFKGVEFWSKALRQAKGSQQLVKFLVAARIDVSPLSVTEERMSDVATRFQFAKAFRTSAATGEGVSALLEEIKKAVNWETVPFNVSEQFFKRTREILSDWKARGELLKTVPELKRAFISIYFKETMSDADFVAVLERIEAHDLIKIFSFGGFLLLAPELLDNYAAAMASAARKQPDGLGYLDEQSAREGWFDFGSLERVKATEERIILQSVVEMFIEKELAISDEGRLIFPSQFNRELPEHPDIEGTTVSYKFEGPLLNIYATLTVRLYHSEAFIANSLWKDAALFQPFGRTSSEHRCGFMLKELAEGTGLLTVFFGPEVVDDTKILFLKYIHEHLSRKSLTGTLHRERIYRCNKCSNEVRDTKAVQNRLARGLPTIPCLYCDPVIHISLVDHIERTFEEKDSFLAEVRRMDEKIDARVDNASKETMLVGRVMTIVGEAGQIYRPTVMHDWGIDGEIEFKDDNGEAAGERIYVQLKSGASHLRQLKNGGRTFQIPKARHVKYWQAHRYPVHLVVLDKDDKIYWMNVTEALAKRGDTHVRSIPFDGAELTVESIKAARHQAFAVHNIAPAAEETHGIMAESLNREQYDVFVATIGKDERLLKSVVTGLKFLKLNSHICDSETTPPNRWFKDIGKWGGDQVRMVIIALSICELVDSQVPQLRSFVSQCVEAKIPLFVVVPKHLQNTQGNMNFLRELPWLEFGDRSSSKTAFERLIRSIFAVKATSSNDN